MKTLNAERNRPEEDLPRPICMGAEAVLYKKENSVLKERVKKSYRIPELDEAIRKQRTSAEKSLLDKARRAGIPVPRVLDSGKFSLELEFLEGEKIKDILNFSKEPEKLGEEIGKIVAQLHSAGIVHGDLTTSNFIISNHKVYLIDFGLGKLSKKVEDQATDLYLLYEALRAAHYKVFSKVWDIILNAYIHNYTNSKETLKRFKQIEHRRRYNSKTVG